ncbi:MULTISPECIES: bifunctional 4-hydroxy-2-oxoglutarate aldolase/2-dehydro-3-deoxy-phosphogluconate aldolase [Amycolatopsis]|uniref:Bifunctional 4-hydroxy-2-oxoglutarate aldolase/2-dehydro-3-deoxy-phosphogluconate aldolase n=1 Tax=Amycolatopsis tucumanensis TaxID=401106 RepID=A0ABP7IE06_9PSEU|nr:MULTISPECIES: bifunctional 4-hydroxy-2-oxoglutarate aldolase/2-dehydro-3-deoxy-phosphogluconate aldolase [Amycolatopsis]MCF6428708.1 bifunctional 4-hydroxy-2-oxoglutarate aldolase/2-dehydro-3-deoxy-phosphogluconate aldolase [Amycolatopsis tucumanensis]
MDPADFFAAHLGRNPVLGIFRGLDPQRTVDMCVRAWDFGVELVEIPVQTPDAMPSLRAAVAAAAERGKSVGAGTVTTVDQLVAVREIGAEFTVAPGLHPEVVTESHRLGLPHLPGVATATEIASALALGNTWLKAFPARQLGAGWITAQLAPFPSVRFVATGGIDAGNAADFLAAGCRGVAVGSALADPDALSALKAAIGG